MATNLVRVQTTASVAISPEALNVNFINNRIIVGTGKGDLIIESVQLEGKRRMSVADFYKGVISKIEGKAISFE